MSSINSHDLPLITPLDNIDGFSLRDNLVPPSATRAPTNPSPSQVYDLLPCSSYTTIRVLDLRPDPQNGLAVTGQLRVVDLAESPRPQFATLSYVWGDFNTPKDTVICNGCSVPVTRNCLAALQHIRVDLLKEGLPIWIDAICIDQDDRADKDVQLPKMGRIYADARKGYIWLGEGTPDTSNAMDYLANGGLPFKGLASLTADGVSMGYWTKLKFAHHLFILSVGRFSIWDLLFGSVPGNHYVRGMSGFREIVNTEEAAFMTSIAVWGRTLSALIIVFFTKRRLQASSLVTIIIVGLLSCLTRPDNRFPSKGLSDILNRPWIERLWTLQEAVLSKNSVVVCGDKLVPWEAIVYTIDYINYIDLKKFSEGLTFPLSFGNWRRLQLFWLLNQRSNPKTAAQMKSLDLRRHSYIKSADNAWKLSLFLALIYHVCCLAVKLLLMGDMPFRVPMSIIVICANVQAFFKLYKEGLRNHHDSAYKIGRSLPYRVSEAVMVEIQARKSQKAEDKYFAVLGLIGGSRTSNLPVDFEQDLKLVYHDLFVTLLDYTGSLNILLFASRKKFTGSPSWVIDWTDAPRCWIRARYYSSMHDGFASRRFPQVKLEEYAGATLESKSIWEYRLNKQQFVVQGRVIGMLAYRSPEFKELDQSSLDIDLLLNIVSFQVAISSKGLIAQEKSIEGLCRFFEACSDRYQGRPSSDEWQQIIRQSASQPTETVREQLKQQQGHNSISTSALAWKYHMAITKFLADEKLVLTSSSTVSGNLALGVAPIDAEVRDVVALISGVSTPMILRVQLPSYNFQIVGPTFLPGAMDGEFWDESQLGELLLV